MNEERQEKEPRLWHSLCCAHLEEKPPNGNVSYLWKVKIWKTRPIYLYFLVFDKVSKLNGNDLFFLDVLFHSLSSILGLFNSFWVLLTFSCLSILNRLHYEG